MGMGVEVAWVSIFPALSCPAIFPAPAWTDPPCWELISMGHFDHERDFKGLGSSVPGNGDKTILLYFIFLYRDPQLGPTSYIVYQSNQVKEEKGEASRKGSDSQTLAHIRLFWKT